MLPKRLHPILRRICLPGLLLSGVVGVLVFAPFLLTPLAERALSRYGGEAGLLIRSEIDHVGLTGGFLERARVEGEGFQVELRGIGLRWDLLQLMDGRVREMTVDRLDAEVEVDAWLPETGWGGLLETSGKGGVSGGGFVRERRSAAGARVHASLLGRAAVEGGGMEGPLPRLPADRLAIAGGTLSLLREDRKLPIGLGLEYLAGGELQQLRFRGDGVGFTAGVRAVTGLRSEDWSAQLSWLGRSPWEVLEGFLPAGHPWHPEGLLPLGVSRLEVGRFELQGLLEGQGRELGSASALGALGKVVVARDDGTFLHARSGSGGFVVREGQLSQFEGVVDFAEVALSGAEASEFMMNVGWRREEGGHLEIPEMALSLPDYGFRTSLAARAFLDSEGAVELQLALQESGILGQVVEPFRFFIHDSGREASGRVSTLRLRSLPDWQLASSRIELQHPPIGDEGPWSGSFASTLEYRPETREVMRMEGGLERTGPESRVDLRVMGELDEELGKGQVLLGADGLSARGKGRWQLADFIPYLFLFSEAIRGVQGSGLAEWSFEMEEDPLLSVAGKLWMELEGVQLAKPEERWSVTGMDAALEFSWRGPFPRSEGPQVIRINRVRFGDSAMEELQIRFEWVHRNRLRVSEFSGSWGGGRVHIEPFSFDPFDPHFESVIRIRGLDAAVLLGKSEETGFRVEGLLDGSLPMRYSAALGLELFRGQLQARADPRAMMYFTEEERIAEMVPLPEQFGLRQKVLGALMSGVRLDRFAVELLDPGQPRRPVMVELQGSIQTPEVELEGIRIRMPHTIDRELQGWRALLFIFSGGTL